VSARHRDGLDPDDPDSANEEVAAEIDASTGIRPSPSLKGKNKRPKEMLFFESVPVAPSKAEIWSA
jgi:hypothetical protein